jgi:hypothetical protein
VEGVGIVVTLFRQDVARNVGELDRDVFVEFDFDDGLKCGWQRRLWLQQHFSNISFIVSGRVTYSAAPPVPSFDEQARIVSRTTITNYLTVLETPTVQGRP